MASKEEVTKLLSQPFQEPKRLQLSGVGPFNLCALLRSSHFHSAKTKWTPKENTAKKDSAAAKKDLIKKALVETKASFFKDPRFTHVFQDLFREFEKAGFRFDQSFLDQVFFGGRGVFFGGVFVWGPFGFRRMKIGGSQERTKVAQPHTPQLQPFGFLKRLGKKIGNFLLGSQKALPASRQNRTLGPLDLTYNLTIPAVEAERGTWLTIAVDRGQGQERLKVKIPPGTRTGSRLRLKGKGKGKGDGGGDLYLTVKLE